MNCHHTIPAKECEICMGNPFHEVLTEEEIAHRKMWKKLNWTQRMSWIFRNLSDNPDEEECKCTPIEKCDIHQFDED